MNVLNLASKIIQEFKTGYRKYAAFAQIEPNKILLLSQESELKMSAELVIIDRTLQIKDQLSFALVKKFTANHQIDLVVVDSQQQQAIFVTHSYATDNNTYDNSLIDSMTFLKVVLGADDKLS